MSAEEKEIDELAKLPQSPPYKDESGKWIVPPPVGRIVASYIIENRDAIKENQIRLARKYSHLFETL